LPGDAADALHPAGNLISATAKTPEIAAAHFCFQLPNQSFSQPASQSFLANQL
jgi:hypothetical protein